ncbi:hypothetical protein E0493_09390 [Roseomonas sp. M0104]|uniref:Autotransporter outer membrane beta-barrel domain-containing protein n=1 Tax=Teichococcus coralli TaxID=2545983 RepID=A0A845BE50_9PROT|nr:hypothetical protein [Pseudoroseomonas coralli]
MLGLLRLSLVLGPAFGQAAAQEIRLPQLPPGIVGTTPRSVAEGVLDLLAYSVVPDGTASALQINRSDDDVGVTLGQLGAGFTVSEGFPLYLEGYLGYARYDPRFVFSDGEQQRRLPARWDQISATFGVGWDFRLARNLYLRPILNAAVAHVTSDAALFGSLVEFRNDINLAFLDRGRMNAWGLGGSLVLAWYDHQPAREIDVELRGTRFHLETFGDTSAAVRGIGTEATTVNLWSRIRWPTGMDAFDRPVRWVLEGQHSRFFGRRDAALGIEYLTKVGGGLELDTGALKIGALGLYVERVRLLGRYVFGRNISGFSVGLGVSF